MQVSRYRAPNVSRNIRQGLGHAAPRCCFTGEVAVLDASGHASLWNTAAMNLITTLTDPHGAANSVAFGPGGVLADADANGNAYLWNSRTRGPRRYPRRP